MTVPAREMELRESICRVHLDSRPAGTGWLARDYVVTAAHVVGSLEDRCLEPGTITLAFPGGTVAATVIEDLIDWDLDVALLRITASAQAGFRRPKGLEISDIPTALDGQVHWWAFGYPPEINRDGHAISGTVASRSVAIGGGATAMQLNVAQSHSDKMHGVSGAPVLVNDRCVGIIRKHPPAIPHGTLYAVRLNDFLDRKGAAGVTLDLGRQQIPRQLQNVLRVQSDWVGALQPLRMPGVAAPPERIVVDQILADDAGSDDAFAAIQEWSKNSTGILITAGAGAGKSWLLAELARRLVADPFALGPSRSAVPLLVSAPDVVRGGEILQAIIAQRRFKHGLRSIEQLENWIQTPELRFVFLVDTLEQAMLGLDQHEALTLFLSELDHLCRQHGHLWIATSRRALSSTRAFQTPKVCRISLWNARQTARYVQQATGQTALVAALKALPEWEVLRRPLLLNAVTQLAQAKGSLSLASPVRILSSFVHAVLHHVRSQVDGNMLPTTVDPSKLASRIALACLEAKDPQRIAREQLVALGVGEGAAGHGADVFVREFLPATSLAQCVGDVLEWAHLLYRDCLAAGAIVDAYRESPPSLKIYANNCSSAAWHTPVGLALALLSEDVPTDTLLEPVDNRTSIDVVVKFLRFGGRLPDAQLRDLVESLGAIVRAERKYLHRCCQIITDGFQPFRTLISLAFLEEARIFLDELSRDEDTPPYVRLFIRARIAEARGDT